MTSNPKHGVSRAAHSKAAIDELLRDVRPIQSVDELAAPEIFESDEELDEFLATVRAHRTSDLA